MSEHRHEESGTQAAAGSDEARGYEVRGDEARVDGARGYETRDVQLKWIVYFGLALAVAAVLIHVGLWLLMTHFSAEANENDPVASPLADRQQEPPPPLLQAQPALDYQKYQREQLERLEQYGWVDRGRGVVRIPIDRAIDLVLERGLPPMPEATGAEAPRATDQDPGAEQERPPNSERRRTP